MVRFLRNWLVPILACMMLVGIAIAFVPLSQREEARAKNELSLLMARAFEAISEGETYADPVIAAEEASLMSKAHAVVRFLEHDDTLLETDALVALCEQLSIDQIDVSNLQGDLIASSNAERIGLALGDDAAFSWTMAAADDPGAAITHADERNRNLLYACAGRTEIDGFVLLTRNDPIVEEALQKSGTEILLSELSYNGDVVFESTAGGEDGFFYDAGCLCARETSNDITLIAARATGDVFPIRNAALAAFGIAALCIVICCIASYLLRLEPVVVLDEPERSDENDPNANASSVEVKHTKKRSAQERAEESEMLAQREQAENHTPKQNRKTGRRKPTYAETENEEEPFEQIVE